MEEEVWEYPFKEGLEEAEEAERGKEGRDRAST